MANYQIHELTSGTVDRDSNVIHDTLNGGNYETRKATAGAVADLANVNVATLYDSATTYAIGQYCLYEGDIYRCIAITTGAFDSTAWTQIVVTGEFRRVVELTSAQYTALSSAEKNNGTLYVITDEETTAADIPYSQGVSVADKLDNVPTFDTLTTSDNNKLLGVSVSGSDISVGAVNPLNGFQIKTYSFNFPNAVGNQVIEIDTGVSEAYLLGCTVDRLVDGVSRYDFIGQYNQSGYCVGFLNNSGSLNVRPYIIDAGGATAYGGRPAKAIFAVKYS